MTTPATVSRDEQYAIAVSVAAMLREQGWGKVSISVSRGGTVAIDVETGDGAKVSGVVPLSRRQR